MSLITDRTLRNDLLIDSNVSRRLFQEVEEDQEQHVGVSPDQIVGTSPDQIVRASHDQEEGGSQPSVLKVLLCLGCVYGIYRVILKRVFKNIGTFFHKEV